MKVTCLQLKIGRPQSRKVLARRRRRDRRITNNRSRTKQRCPANKAESRAILRNESCSTSARTSMSLTVLRAGRARSALWTSLASPMSSSSQTRYIAISRMWSRCRIWTPMWKFYCKRAVSRGNKTINRMMKNLSTRRIISRRWKQSERTTNRIRTEFLRWVDRWIHSRNSRRHQRICANWKDHRIGIRRRRIQPTQKPPSATCTPSTWFSIPNRKKVISSSRRRVILMMRTSMISPRCTSHQTCPTSTTMHSTASTRTSPYKIRIANR